METSLESPPPPHGMALFVHFLTFPLWWLPSDGRGVLSTHSSIRHGYGSEQWGCWLLKNQQRGPCLQRNEGEWGSNRVREQCCSISISFTVRHNIVKSWNVLHEHNNDIRRQRAFKRSGKIDLRSIWSLRNFKVRKRGFSLLWLWHCMVRNKIDIIKKKRYWFPSKK